MAPQPDTAGQRLMGGLTPPARPWKRLHLQT